jgi:hypothetical protein
LAIVPYKVYIGRKEEPQSPPAPSPLALREIAQLKQPVPAGPTVEQRIEEARQQGLQDGRNAARIEYELIAAQERRRSQEQVVAMRTQWAGEEGALLAEQIAASFLELERRVSDQVARILEPYLVATVRDRVIDELVANIRRLLAGDTKTVLRISGAADLLELVHSRLGEFSRSVEYLSDGAPEVTVLAGDTEIQTQLQAWRAGLDLTGE